MWGPLLLLQLATSTAPAASNYSTPGLAKFIAVAALANRVPPPSLQAYRAHVESELSLILRDTLGREHVAQVEQVALQAQWRRPFDYDLHIVGYRSASVGVPYSALSFARSWTVPHLYGDRLTLGVDITRGSGKTSRGPLGEARDGRDSSKASDRTTPAVHAVHPLATDRDRFYRFDGGDTIAFVHSGNRMVPILRVRVIPALESVSRDSSVSAFDGEIDFDATRHQIVRMRGRLVTRMAAKHGLRATLTQLPGLVAVAFVEFVNAEVDGRYWLPQFQRTEFQATFAPFGSQRSVFRLVSHFSRLGTTAGSLVDGDSGIVDSTAAARQPSNASVPEVDRGARRVLSYATEDSVSRFDQWLQPLGGATASVTASDFDDLLPDPWRPSGPPRFEFAPTKLDDVFRYDRIEGLYTGVAATLRFRDAAPGLSARAYGGWAWTEETPRGGLSINLARGQRNIGARVERGLVSTNDFSVPLDAGTIGFGGMFGADDQDYVDRRVAAVGLTSGLGSVQTGVITAEAALGDDHGEIARLTRGLFGSAQFRNNRASANGRYVRGTAIFEWHPDVTGLFLEPGAGLVSSYEIGRGQLNWQRAELTLSMRHNLRDLTVSGRAEGGVVMGRDIPPQQLFELGGEGALPGYAYKEFAGDRAAAVGVLVSYPLPVLRRPWRVIRSLVLPGIGPGLAAGIESGWAEASSASAFRSIRALDPLTSTTCIETPGPGCPSALSVPTGAVRATVDARLTVFGGLLGVGVARPIDRSAPWRLVFRFGQEY